LVRKTGLGLQKIGLKKGDAIALIGDNIPEMLFTAIGAQAVGGISAAIYQTTMPEEIAQLLDYMNVTMVFCDDQEQVDKIVEIRDRSRASGMSFTKTPAACAATGPMTGSFLSRISIDWAMTSMPKTRIYSSPWWMKAPPTRSATSA
jgi:long-subunit acyl-CoA synthetase (AMP-forming)